MIGSLTSLVWVNIRFVFGFCVDSATSSISLGLKVLVWAIRLCSQSISLAGRYDDRCVGLTFSQEMGVPSNQT